MKTIIYGLILSAMAVAAPSRALGAYTVIDLGSLGGPSYPIGSNNDRQVLGRSYITNFVGNLTQHGFVWDPRHGLRELRTVVGLDTTNTPACLDNQGRIGFNMNSRGYLWHPVSGLTDLNAGATNGQPLKTITRISEAGHILGVLGGECYLQEGDALQQFTGFQSVAALNRHGWVWGRDHLGPATAPFRGHALFWDATNGFRNLGVLPGKATAMVEGLNSHGHAVGWSAEFAAYFGTLVPAIATASFWTGASLTPLPPPTWRRESWFTNTQAHAINDAGQIVGRAHYSLHSLATPYLPDGDAVLWTNGVPVNLNTLLPLDSGWVLQSANAINNHGDIVGYGLHHGQTRAYLCSRPTPGRRH